MTVTFCRFMFVEIIRLTSLVCKLFVINHFLSLKVKAQPIVILGACVYPTLTAFFYSILSEECF